MNSKFSLEYFSETNWSFVLIKQDKIIYKSKLQGLKPLIFCIKKYKREMPGATVYDKIVGRAAAILLAHAGVGEVWTPAASGAGREYLEKKGISLAYKKAVSYVRNKQGNAMCPMEKMSGEMQPKEFAARMLGKRDKFSLFKAKNKTKKTRKNT